MPEFKAKGEHGFPMIGLYSKLTISLVFENTQSGAAVANETVIHPGGQSQSTRILFTFLNQPRLL
ncbi:hypothetical protein C0991_004290 [Blastosporella zonata]|nr:hypothetical protein C0991_004290 [Blastosporella zonata]